MSKIVLKNASVVVNSVDLSNHTSSVSIETEFDEVDLTAFGSTYREFGQGLGDATINIEVFQDFDAASIDSTLWPLSQSGGTFPVVVKPTSAAVGTANPSYTMTARLFSYNPVDGSVGDASTTQVSFRNAGTAGLVRGTV